MFGGGEGTSGDQMSTDSQGESNVDLDKSKFNESEIFENEQTDKEIHERSFIYIQNAKSRLPWKIKTRGSSSLVDEFINNAFKNGDGSFVHLKNVTKSNLPNRNYYNSNNYPFSSMFNRRNMMGITKQQSASSNERTLPPPTLVTMKPYYRNELKSPVRGKAHKNMYNQKEYPKINNPNEIGRHYKSHAVTVLVTQFPPTLPLNFETSKKDNFQKFNKFVNDNGNRESYYANDKKLDCFSLDCLPLSKTYRVNINNGIKRGSKCECENSPSAKKRAQLWRARKIPVNASEKSIRSLSTIDSESFYEQLIKETTKFTKAVEEME